MLTTCSLQSWSYLLLNFSGLIKYITVIAELQKFVLCVSSFDHDCNLCQVQ